MMRNSGRILAALMTAALAAAGCANAAAVPQAQQTTQEQEQMDTQAQESTEAEAGAEAEAGTGAEAGAEAETGADAETGTSAQQSAAASAASAADSGTLTVALQQEVTDLDPAAVQGDAAVQVISQICEPLLQKGENGELQPLLASSWEAEDSLTYVYQIRDDVTFSDGEPLSMEDVVFSLERHMDDDTGSVYAERYAHVQSVEQTDEWELTVHLSDPDPSWQYTAATPAAAVVQEAYWEDEDEFGLPGTGVIGTGPYVIEKWESPDEIVLAARTDYPDSEAPLPIQKIVFKSFRDEAALTSQLKSGQADLCIGPTQEVLQSLEGTAGLHVEEAASSSCLCLVMNCSGEDLSDPEVRRAIAYAIDRDGMFDEILAGTGQKAVCAMPFGQVQYGGQTSFWDSYREEAYDPKGDPEEAASVLEESSRPDGFSCRLAVKDTPVRSACADKVAQDLEEIGIEVEVEKLGGPQMIGYQTGIDRDYDMLLMLWEADYPDPAATLEALFSSDQIGEGGSNVSRYKNKEVDQLLADQKSSTDPEERAQYMADAMDIAAEEVPLIPLCCPTVKVIVNDRLDYGVPADPAGALYVKNVKIR